MEIEKELVYKIAFSESDDEFIASVNTVPPLSVKDDTPNAALMGLRELIAKKVKLNTKLT